MWSAIDGHAGCCEGGRQGACAQAGSVVPAKE